MEVEHVILIIGFIYLHPKRISLKSSQRRIIRTTKPYRDNSGLDDTTGHDIIYLRSPHKYLEVNFAHKVPFPNANAL